MWYDTMYSHVSLSFLNLYSHVSRHDSLRRNMVQLDALVRGGSARGIGSVLLRVGRLYGGKIGEVGESACGLRLGERMELVQAGEPAVCLRQRAMDGTVRR